MGRRTFDLLNRGYCIKAQKEKDEESPQVSGWECSQSASDQEDGGRRDENLSR